jgi:hypothetical protein
MFHSGVIIGRNGQYIPIGLGGGVIFVAPTDRHSYRNLNNCPKMPKMRHKVQYLEAHQK